MKNMPSIIHPIMMMHSRFKLPDAKHAIMFIIIKVIEIQCAKNTFEM